MMKYLHVFLLSVMISGVFAVSACASDPHSVSAHVSSASAGDALESDNSSPESGIYKISSFTNGDLVLEMQTCTVTESENSHLQLYSSLDNNQQKFYIEAISPDLYRISTLTSGEALTAELPPDFVDPDITIDLQSDTSSDVIDEDEIYSGEVSLEPIVLENAGTDRNETKNQQAQLWSFEKTAAGFYYIRSAGGKYLTVDSDYAHKGACVILQDFTGERSQKWRIHKTWGSSAAPVDTDLIDPYAEDGEFSNFRLTIQFGEHTETLTASDFSGWMTETEEHRLTLDREAVTSYVKKLAETYDTQGKPRSFTTSYGNTITLYKGDFGWKLDVSDTVDLILEAAKKGSYLVTDPVWEHYGNLFEAGNDIGDSYVEVDLTNQKVWLYVDGEQILETDCVTGTYGTDRQTPGGVYSVYYRKSPDVLDGEGYSSPVEYWMAFNGGIGLHDANWRYSFGGDIYKTNGSHGCINLPLQAAAKIYEVAQIGFPVVCYN